MTYERRHVRRLGRNQTVDRAQSYKCLSELARRVIEAVRVE